MSESTGFKQAGFTLMELIIVIVLISTFVLTAIPVVSEYMLNATTGTVAREILGKFQNAKMEAVKRNQNVAIVFSTAGTDNYQTYIDTDADGTLDAGEEILSTVEMPESHTLTLNAILIARSNTVGFDPRGRPYMPQPTPRPWTWPSDPQVVVTNTSTSKTVTFTAFVAGAMNLQ